MFGAVLNRIGNRLAGANRIDRALVIVGNMKMAPMSDRESGGTPRLFVDCFRRRWGAAAGFVQFFG